MTADFNHLAKQIKAKLGSPIAKACAGTLVPDSFLAGLISQENARLDPHAFRFERHVLAALKDVRSRLKPWRKSYNGITQGDLRGLSDDALANLATSWGYCQVMGWHVIRNLKNQDGSAVTIGQLRDPALHLSYAVQLLHLTAARYLKVHSYGSVLKIWNTGSPYRDTYHVDYVPNALAVMQEYRKLGASVRTSRVVPPRNPTTRLPNTDAMSDGPATFL